MYPFQNAYIRKMYLAIDLGWEYLVLVAVGFAAGFINTLAGGGSLLTLPMLIFLGLPSAVANGTNRIAILIQTFFATAGFKSKGVSTFPFNIYLGISAMLGAFLGAKIAVDIQGEIFNKILAVIMIVVVALMVFKPKLEADFQKERLTGYHLWVAIFAFFFIGIYGGFINAGIGFIIMLFLHYFNKMSLIRVNATKVSLVFVYTIGALIMFALNDKIDWMVGLILAIGNASGAWVGSRWSVKKGDGVIKAAMVIMVCLMSLKLWFF